MICWHQFHSVFRRIMLDTFILLAYSLEIYNMITMQSIGCPQKNRACQYISVFWQI